MSFIIPRSKLQPDPTRFSQAPFSFSQARLHRAPKTNHSPLSTWRLRTGQGTGIQGCFLVYITTSTVSSSLRTQPQTPPRTAAVGK